MNHATKRYGNAANVASQFATDTGIVYPCKLLDVMCLNNTAGLLYMQVFNTPNNLVAFGSSYVLGVFNVATVIGHTYQYFLGPNELSLSDGATSYQKSDSSAGTYIATTTQAQFHGSAGATAPVTGSLLDISQITTRPATPAPAAGATASFSFPVQPGLGGTLGRCVDMAGVFCAWSSDQVIYTAPGGTPGSIIIICKG